MERVVLRVGETSVACVRNNEWLFVPLAAVGAFGTLGPNEPEPAQTPSSDDSSTTEEPKESAPPEELTESAPPEPPARAEPDLVPTTTPTTTVPPPSAPAPRSAPHLRVSPAAPCPTLHTAAAQSLPAPAPAV